MENLRPLKLTPQNDPILLNSVGCNRSSHEPVTISLCNACWANNTGYN